VIGPTILRHLKPRWILFLGIVAYIAIVNWTYVDFVATIYPFYGLSYNPPPLSYQLISWALSILPALWLPLDLRRPSLIFFLIQYLVIFIPAAFILYHCSKPPLSPDEALDLILLMFAGLSIMQSIYLLPRIRFGRIMLPFGTFWITFLSILIALSGYLLFTLGSHFHLAGLEGMYQVRLTTASILSQSGTLLGLYAQPWLAGFFLPLCCALSFFSKRYWILAFVAIGYLFLFGIGGSKSTLLAFIFIPCAYFWLRKTNKNSTIKLVCALSLILGSLIPLSVFLPPQIIRWYVAIVHFRTFSIPSLLIAQYFDFFKHNPLTYMSHVNGINLFIQYPYSGDLPRIIGQYFYGGPVGLNAGLWAADGLASFGPIGIPIISMLAAIVLWILDSLSTPYDPRFVAVASTFIVLSFANVPLTTTLLSGGLGFLMITLVALPKSGLVRNALRGPLYQEIL
jgi:hypothetical protein